MEYDNTNRGALFKNDEKAADTHADYNGSINVNGTDYWLNAWVKESKGGKKFFSLSVKEKGKPTNKPAKREALDESDIPF